MEQALFDDPLQDLNQKPRRLLVEKRRPRVGLR